MSIRLPRPAPRCTVAAASIALLSLLAAGCSGLPSERGWSEGGEQPLTDGPGDPTRARLALDVDVRDLPKSRIGNAPQYTVFGQRYAVMDTAAGFRERGIASWYGAKFHGNDTSSGERYDMHLMSAAHKHLPLPTFVRVTRTDTGRSVVVKVNDRGPFVGDRIIDLSYGAAARLDMLDSGTAPVMLEALSTHLPGGRRPVETLVTRERDAAPSSAPVSPEPALTTTSESTLEVTADLLPGRNPSPDAPAAPVQWIQVGAFSDQDNARAALAVAAGSTGLGGRVERDANDALYRVRLGPIDPLHGPGGAIEALAQAGVGSYTMVSAAH